ncbi:MAG: hypothetical protein ABL921_08365 [Pirellula sp.]
MGRVCAASVIAVLLLAPGCGDGLDRFRVRGTVTYEGKPVEAGMIFFEPTSSAGSIAPTTYLSIKAGKYDAGSEGPTKGKYRVTVGGFDRANEKKDGEGTVFTPSLFPDYKFETEIPPENNVLDIEVPSKKKK